MRRGTTPTLTLTIKDADLAGYHIEVAITQGGKVMTKTTDEVDMQYADPDTVISMELTQQDTLGFKSGKMASIQVRFVNADGVAGATNIQNVNIDRILREGVIAYD